MECYKENRGSIYVWKSMRKNAKCLRDIYVVHLINHDPEGKLTDGRIIDHFVSEAEKIFAASEREFCLSVSMFENREVRNVTNSQKWFWVSQREHFNHPVSMLYWLWFNFFCRIYPYNTVDFTEIEMNPSIKYMINEWKEAQNVTGDD